MRFLHFGRNDVAWQKIWEGLDIKKPRRVARFLGFGGLLAVRRGLAQTFNNLCCVVMDMKDRVRSRINRENLKIYNLVDTVTVQVWAGLVVQIRLYYCFFITAAITKQVGCEIHHILVPEVFGGR